MDRQRQLQPRDGYLYLVSSYTLFPQPAIYARSEASRAQRDLFYRYRRCCGFRGAPIRHCEMALEF